MNTPHDTALSKAKIQLMAKPDSSFFTHLCFSMRHIWDESIPTACTDGLTIRYNPAFFMGMSAAEQVFLIIHESMHVAYLHMDRLMGRDHARWNAACDYVINLQLVERGFTMPSSGLLDKQFAGMNAEQVYDLLPRSAQPPMFDLSSCSDPEKIKQLTADVQDILVRATIQSKMAGDKPGTVPGDITILLDKLLNPRLPWTKLLQRFMSSFAKDDYTFRRPNRRYFPKYHMPTLRSEKLMDLSMAVDTSGSVSDKDFQVFISEVASILRMMNPDTISLVQFDTNIKSVDKVRSVRELESLRFTGRGGTCIDPVMEWAKESKPQLLLIFSDGEFQEANAQPPGEVLWIIHNNKRFTAPFGKVIHYDVN